VGAELFLAGGPDYRDRQTDRQTDITKLIVTLVTCDSAPKNDLQRHKQTTLARTCEIILTIEPV